MKFLKFLKETLPVLLVTSLHILSIGLSNNFHSKTPLPIEEPGQYPRPQVASVAAIVAGIFVIGNSVSMFMGAWPVTFEEVEMEQETQEVVADYRELLLDDPENPDLLMEAGAIYFRYNFLDEAEELLSKAFELSPENSQIKAYFGALEAKRAGEMLDLLFGIRKKNQLNSGLKKLDEAHTETPEDRLVEVIRLSTVASVGELAPSFGDIPKAIFKWELKIPEELDILEQTRVLAFAEFYLKKEEGRNIEKARRFIQMAEKAENSDNPIKAKIKQLNNFIESYENS